MLKYPHDEAAIVRRQKFNALFDSMQGRNVDRIRVVAGTLGIKENTVRIWLMQDSPRIIPAGSLAILQRDLQQS